jgi:polygalacturonase
MSIEKTRRQFMSAMTATAAVSVPLATMAATATDTGERSGTSLFNVLDFGAVPDGKTSCTIAIQKAVDACSKLGGGIVLIPAGNYLTSAIFLKSNVHIEVTAGARLLFTTNFDDVPSIRGRWEGIDRTTYASLFTGHNLENVSLTGRGTLDGQGEAWWTAFRKDRELRRKLGLGEREPENPATAVLRWGRPRMINLYDCKNVFLNGLMIVNSPAWNIHPVRCENVLIDGVTILAPSDSPNTDGIDPDSCKNVRISNCHISVGDDCIIIKSGYKYRKDGVRSEQIAVTNCVFGNGHAGVGIGSETAGGVRDVVISNCVCEGTIAGLRFKTARTRGNVVENVRASNFVMRGVRQAVIVTMFYNGGDIHQKAPVDQGTPVFRNFRFSDITGTDVDSAVVIEGLPEMPIEGITLTDVCINGAKTGATCTNAHGVILNGVSIEAAKGPALSVDTARDVQVYRFNGKAPVDEPVIRFQQVEAGVVQSCTTTGEEVLLELAGTGNREIRLINNRIGNKTQEVKFLTGASESAVVPRT